MTAAMLRAFGLLVALVALVPSDRVAGNEPARLGLHDHRDRVLAADETHAYLVEPGRPARLIVEQRGVDVEITVETGAEDRLVADQPFDRRAWESVLLVGAVSYRISVQGREAGAPPGRYALRLEPVDGDLRLAAARATTAAGRLYRQGSADAWREALVHHRRAFEVWSSLDERGESALSLYAQAVIQRLLNAPGEGLVAAREARRRFRELGEPFLEAYASNEIGLDQWRLGELDAARRTFEGVVALEPGEVDELVAAAVASNLCLLELSRGEIAAGRACYQSSLPVIEAARAPQVESAARTNLGRLAEHFGEPDEGLAHYRRALELHTVSRSRRGQAQVLNNLGVLLRGRGELDAAMESYAAAAEIFEELGERRWLARVLSNTGYAYRLVDEPRRAQDSFERALELFRETQDRRGEATTLDNLGLVELRLGRPAEALELHRRALGLRRLDGDRRGEAVALRRLGDVHAELGELETARLRLGEAVAIASELGDQTGEAAARQALGTLHLEGAELGAARAELEASRWLAAAAGQATLEAASWFQLARVERSAGRPEVARQRLAAARQRLEDVRNRIASPDLRTSYSSLVRRVDELDVELSMTAHRADPKAGHGRRGLVAAERARAQTLLELLQEAEIDLAVDVPPELVARRRSLARRLEAKTERLTDPSLDTASRETLETERLVLLQRREALDAELRRASPAFSELVRPRALGTEEVQALVDGDTVLAVYFLGETVSYLWRVEPEAVESFELPGRATIETAGRRVHESWSRHDPSHRAEAHRDALELGEMLRLAELLGGQRLAIIADGALHLVPFAALPVPDSSGGSPAPLVDWVEIALLPSASVLAYDRRSRRPGWGAAGQKGVAVLADPAFAPDAPRLPASRLEAAAIAAAVPPAKLLVALGADVDRELVESGRLRGYGVVHFATHGVIDTEHPAQSGLRLSGGAFLRLHDLFQLPLDAELVVLSGCRTALGPVARGEGLVGLARAFLHAGSRRVVASLWQVEDRATAELMQRFYRALWEEQLPPAAALTVAQRQMSRTRRYRDPHHWAGFVALGDWR